jgi:ligand-binding SRPBCC domain-containing protein
VQLLHGGYFYIADPSFYFLRMVHSIKTVQLIPTTLDKAWDFFSSPANLQKITPPSMRFHIISQHHGEKMYPGQIIEYKVRPLLNVPVYWMTEITHVKEKIFFIDEQRYGPYSMWHHQHHFREVSNGVEMTDIVHYKIPLGFMGDLVNAMWVKKELKKIFDFRRQKVVEIFG